MKKNIIAVLLCLLAVFALAACKGDALPDEPIVTDTGDAAPAGDDPVDPGVTPPAGNDPGDTGATLSDDTGTSKKPPSEWAEEREKLTLTFDTKDGITVTADLYRIHNEAPCVIMFHKDDSSRGEYHRIAPLLNDIGFNCLAVDLRLGWESNGVLNSTYAGAIAQWRYVDVFTSEDSFINALPDVMIDMMTAVLYARNELKAEKIIIMGSGYSATLALAIASEFPEIMDGVMSLSPLDLVVDGKTIEDYATAITGPVLITVQLESGQKEEIEAIFERIPSEEKYLVITDDHATDALAYENADTATIENPVWRPVIDFLLAYLVHSDEWIIWN